MRAPAGPSWSIKPISESFLEQEIFVAKGEEVRLKTQGTASSIHPALGGFDPEGNITSLTTALRESKATICLET